MKEAIDKLETLILLLMDGSHSAHVSSDGRSEFHVKKGKHGYAFEGTTYDITERIASDAMVPVSVFSADMTQSRNFAITPDLLMTHPAEIIGDSLEAALFCDDYIKWQGFRRCKPPKRIAAAGKAVVWFEHHFRIIRLNGSGSYQKSFIPLERNGRALFAKMDGLTVCRPDESTLNLCGACSIVEDAHRSNAMLCSVKDAVEVNIPVPLDDYQDVFAERDGPMNGARRKTIVHWVARHMRHSTRGKEFAVKKHTRGVQEFTIDGLRVRLTPNESPVD